MSEAKKTAPAGSGQKPPSRQICWTTIVEEGRFGKEPRPGTRQGPDQRVRRPGARRVKMTVSKDTVAMIKARIAQIDQLLTEQLNEILHAQEFQKLEASWRGLHYLVINTETSTRLKLRLLNVTKKELLNDLEKATEFDQSALFKKIYEEEYGTFGGHPFSLLVGDLRVRPPSAGHGACSRRSRTSPPPRTRRSSPAPARELFDMDSFTELGTPRDLAKIFESPELLKWRSFRESEDSRYVALVLPHILLRLPYGPDTMPVEGFQFRRRRRRHAITRKYLWGNAAWALGAAHHQRLRALQLVRGHPRRRRRRHRRRPAHPHLQDRRGRRRPQVPDRDRHHRPPREGARGPRLHPSGALQGHRLRRLLRRPDRRRSRRSTTPTRPTPTPASRRMLPYILAASRFAHYIKAIMRDKIGSFMSRSQAERFLNDWIQTYTIGDDDAPAQIKARNPLREARVEVVEVPGKPGAYRAVAFLRPHYQLDELSVSLRLVAELPPPVR